jgi:alkanesulfonate monooxygenase SsuD/methylene tetrahydromethanopterin reductase-like flavin-dependent oxidoreductase (luciferase family)
LIDVAIMIEGQDGLNWPRWQRMARAVEDLGFSGLFRSDHYTNAKSPDKDALELWVSLTWLASNTRHIDFGPLVSPLSFRHPTHTARGNHPPAGESPAGGLSRFVLPAPGSFLAAEAK